MDSNIGTLKISRSNYIYWIDIKDHPVVIANRIIESELFMRRWKTCQKSIKLQLKKFPPEILEASLNGNISLRKIFKYVMHLSHNTIYQYPKKSYLSYEIQQEFNREMYRGKICVYSSVLLYNLIKRLNLNVEMSFVQGFYTLRFLPKTLQRLVIGEKVIAAHAFLVINNSIIDATLQQIGENYSLGGKEYMIVGNNLPSNIDLYGWKEDENTILEYTKEFALYRDLSLDDWITSHEIAANQVMGHHNMSQIT